jgi:hypothetical protein
LSSILTVDQIYASKEDKKGCPKPLLSIKRLFLNVSFEEPYTMVNARRWGKSKALEIDNWMPRLGYTKAQCVFCRLHPPSPVTALFYPSAEAFFYAYNGLQKIFQKILEFEFYIDAENKNELKVSKVDFF